MCVQRGGLHRLRNGNVYALNASTGTRLWSYTTADIVDSSPAVANGRSMCAATTATCLRSISPVGEPRRTARAGVALCAPTTSCQSSTSQVHDHLKPHSVRRPSNLGLDRSQPILWAWLEPTQHAPCTGPYRTTAVELGVMAILAGPRVSTIDSAPAWSEGCRCSAMNVFGSAATLIRETDAMTDLTARLHFPG